MWVVGYIPRWFADPETVTHPSTSRAQCRTTLLMRPTPLPLRRYLCVYVCDVQFDKVAKLSKDFEPFRMLWITTSDWLRWYDSWMNDPLSDVDAEKVDKNVTDAYKTIHKCVKVFQGISGQCRNSRQAAVVACVVVVCFIFSGRF